MRSDSNQAVIKRFVAACQTDDRIVAAFLGGSSAAGTADEHSDLDLYLITTDEAYDHFFAGRETFMRHLGEPVFLEDFNGFGFDMLVFIFSDGKAMAREQLWTAYGYLDKLRLKCVNLARLEYNFTIGAEGYEKLDRAIPVQQLALLQATFCTLEPEAMLKAVVVIVQFYLDKAHSLARKHEVTYPMNLERGIGSRFEQLSNASLNDTRESYHAKSLATPHWSQTLRVDN